MQQLKAQAEQKGYAWIDWNVCAEDATASHPNAAQILRNVQNDAEGPADLCCFDARYQCHPRDSQGIAGYP